jgi:hypothetical protein
MDIAKKFERPCQKKERQANPSRLMKEEEPCPT